MYKNPKTEACLTSLKKQGGLCCPGEEDMGQNNRMERGEGWALTMKGSVLQHKDWILS